MSGTKGVVVYDGDCRLCRDSVGWLRRLDSGGRLEYADLSAWEETERRFPDLDRTRCLEELHLVLPDGQIERGFDALRSVARFLPHLRWFAPLLSLPGIPWLGRKVYHAIARRRHGLLRSTDPCG